MHTSQIETGEINNPKPRISLNTQSNQVSLELLELSGGAVKAVNGIAQLLASQIGNGAPARANLLASKTRSSACWKGNPLELPAGDCSLEVEEVTAYTA